jgi:ribose transport system substrate-binding protein
MNALRAAALAATCLTTAAQADDIVSQAKQVVAKATAPASAWDGPTTGPKAASGKSIVYVAADLRNGGIQENSAGVKQAAAKIGWRLRIIDGQGSVDGIASAYGQAIALKPDGIVIGGFDGVQSASTTQRATAQGIKVVSWHGGAAPGPMTAAGIFDNVTSDSRKVAETAADYAIALSDGHAGVVILTDSSYAIALAKARNMEAQIKKCTGCTVLAFQDTPLAETSTRVPPLTTATLQRYGQKWTYSLAINDLYYDFMGPALSSAGRDPAGPPVNISAGDGSKSAYERIRDKQYQAATVPEPLLLQGWQVVDELNRAFNNAPSSGYVAPIHLVTADNVDRDGGKDDIYDPANGYRAAYAKIWGH